MKVLAKQVEGYKDGRAPTPRPRASRWPPADVAAILTGGGAALLARREASRWSPLEYGCHVRDMLLVQRERLLATRRLDKPVAEPMGRDERPDLDGYSEQDPADVARQLRDAAQMMAHDLARLSGTDWERTLTYTYPSRAERSLGWLAIHTAHEVRHHLIDVREQLAETPRHPAKCHGSAPEPSHWTPGEDARSW